jgi:hypothetical protein
MVKKLDKPIILKKDQIIRGINGDIYAYDIVNGEVYIKNLTGKNDITVHEAVTKILDNQFRIYTKPDIPLFKFDGALAKKLLKQKKYKDKQRKRVNFKKKG